MQIKVMDLRQPVICHEETEEPASHSSGKPVVISITWLKDSTQHSAFSHHPIRAVKVRFGLGMGLELGLE